MKVSIVQIENEHREVDHLAQNDQTDTLCGKPWTHRTRREFLNDERYETSCYRCKEAARRKIIASLAAARLLARWADLDWKSLKRAAQVYD